MTRLALLLLALALTPGVARAQNSGAVDPLTGALTTQVPIAVPDFRAITPALSLAYNSASGDGFVGVGWALTGTSIITRRSPGGGTPRYDASDVFYLDGAELVPCTSQGGTHCTWIQNYTRIRQDDPVVGQWTVTGTTGNVATYEPRLVTALVTESWLLTSMVDPNGNQVTYSYACDPPSAQYPDECYIHEITYNGNSVRFHKELRPDPISRANGSFIALMRYRLKSIQVVVGTGVNAVTARAYQITYRESADTGRSIVDSVQQFGRGAAVAADGSVTGPSLPAMTFDYPTEASPGSFPFEGDAGTYQALDWEDPFFSSHTSDEFKNRHLFGVGDFNGDGRADVHGFQSIHPFWIGLADGDSSDPYYTLQPFILGPSCVYDTGFPIYAADLNADGRTDLWHACVDDGELRVEAWLSQGDGTFSTTAVSTTAGMGWSWSQPGLQVVPGDVNGDGQGDVIAVYRQSETDVRIRIGFGEDDGTFGNWEESSHTLSWPQADGIDRIAWLPGDYNADGYADLLAPYDSGGTLALHFALRDPGQGFDTGSVSTPWPAPADWNQHWSDPSDDHFFLQGDANGDALLDFMMVQDVGGVAALRVALSRGLSPGATPFDFDSDDTTVAWSGVHEFGLGFAGDINADGKDEFHLYYVESWDPVYAVFPDHFDLTTFFRRDDGGYDSRTMSRFADYTTLSEGVTWWVYPQSHDLFAVVDQDGDGVRDIIQISGQLYHDSFGIDDYFVRYLPWLSQAEPDLVTSVSNGIGGRSDIDYAPSSTWSNQYLPEGLVLQTVESITTYDGRTGSGGPISGTTTFTYEGGLWSNAERRFLGFRQVTSVVDDTGATTEVLFHQEEGTISKPDWIYVRNALNQNSIITASNFVYSDDPDDLPPWVSVLTDRFDYECNGATTTANCRSVLTQFTYDIYGNVLTTQEHGNYPDEGEEGLGDERTTTRTYGLDPTKYLVAQPLSEVVQKGAQKSKWTNWWYDANGNLIQQRENSQLSCGSFGCLLSGVNTLYTPDAYGNIVEVSVATSSLTTTFDPVYHRFPTSRCNSLGHCVTYEWDPVWGKPTKVTGPNGEETRVVYDDFARVTSVQRLGPGGVDVGGGTTQYEYLEFGNPNLQRTRIVRPDGTGDGLWTEVYRDGLGREYKVVHEGGITRTREFNGVLTRTWKESLWHDASTPPEDIEYVTYGYDQVSRLRTLLNADGSELEVVYGLGFRDVYDELDQHRRIFTDGLGRTTQVRETNGGESYTTYSYDASDRVIQSVDDDVNVSSYVWNWLGDKKKACVPDMGCTTYVYGNLGTLTSQRNALSQTISYTYDAEGRLLTKTHPGGQQVQWHYDEPGHGWSLGRPTRVEFAPSASLSVEYDELGRVIAEDRCVSSACKHFDFSYDALDRLATLTYPDGEQVVYDYDTQGRLDRVTTPGPLPDYVTNLEWTPAGQLASMTYGNGAVTTYGYHPEREWLEDVTVVSGGQPLYDASYVVDPAARIDSMTVNRGSGPVTWDFGYDDLNRLTTLNGGVGAPSETYSYDSIGNLLTKGSLGYEYTIAGMPHAVSKVGATRYIYDANGNRKEKHL